MISKSNARMELAMELAIARDRIKELEGQIEIIGKANRDIVKESELANSNLGPALAGYNKLREALVTSNVKLHDYSTSIGSRVENATYVINEALKGEKT